MKRGFLDKPNAFGKTLTPRTDNGSSNIVQQSLKLAALSLAEQSRMPGEGDEAKVENNGGNNKVGLKSSPDAYRRGPKGPDTYRLNDVPDIEYGELILTERPLLVFPASPRHMSSLAYPKHFTIDQIQQAQLNQLEKLMETLVDQMPKENQEAYKKLANCHQEDGSGPLLGIARTNGFPIGDYYEPKIPGFPEAATRYSATFKDISRINHSCRPNACRDWDSPTFSFHLRASKPIKKGQEITLSYISDAVDPTSERQRQLASYGFTCTCEACSNPEISDPRSKQIKELLNPTVSMINPMMLGLLDPAIGNGLGMDKALLESSSSLGMALGMPGGTQMSKEKKKGKGPPGPGVENVDDIFNMAKQLGQNTIEPALKGLKLLEEEGLTGTIWYGNLLERVSNGYTMMALNSREMDREAMKWHQKSEKYKKLFKSARNAKWREEKEREEKSKKKGQEMWNDDEEYKKLVDEMNKKMFATRPRLGA
ncbi:hypothetical protein K435DRAFT_786345 [Dendrothele bispora CBS 962.96]|uniref:SET domain-containing protein n=1 Tax=Dendrothele bispora (strain CBS 962.96) TaxID=1314807 RepID=A0A4S8KRB7_DENBC|nr:hypothetical protein K435DRAFT_786345 [Dendrothele bispora CBS 962.96]